MQKIDLHTCGNDLENEYLKTLEKRSSTQKAETQIQSWQDERRWQQIPAEFTKKIYRHYYLDFGKNYTTTIGA